ncbi:uncharacterized protein LOC128335093 isoform X2 [Hemicordylus capensis]|uniref:uncharacterized protein LOC128335093 isoform X2 n=1 Tax=Hemicordylus capensis TaxID=884348 RepID=UPI0023047190|nr:uncharacterized protein LOC128335093 isoform X2 [Hemicordylus capensis]
MGGCCSWAICRSRHSAEEARDEDEEEAQMGPSVLPDTLVLPEALPVPSIPSEAPEAEHQQEADSLPGPWPVPSTPSSTLGDPPKEETPLRGPLPRAGRPSRYYRRRRRGGRLAARTRPRGFRPLATVVEEPEDKTFVASGPGPQAGLFHPTPEPPLAAQDHLRGVLILSAGQVKYIQQQLKLRRVASPSFLFVWGLAHQGPDSRTRLCKSRSRLPRREKDVLQLTML